MRIEYRLSDLLYAFMPSLARKVVLVETRQVVKEVVRA
jgi:hypothetical protein